MVGVQYIEESVTSDIHDKTELLREIDESTDAAGELNGLKTWETLYKEASLKGSKSPLMGSSEIQSKTFWLAPESLKKLRAEMQNHAVDRPTMFESVMAHA